LGLILDSSGSYTQTNAQQREVRWKVDAFGSSLNSRSTQQAILFLCTTIKNGEANLVVLQKKKKKKNPTFTND